MLNRTIALVGFCAWLVGWAAFTNANAAEQIVVPFTCKTGGGDVYARPSQPRSYTVIGEREAAPFTACASDGSDRCRTLMLHRFDIDCDGQRVGWPEFYAAISDATTGRAYIEDDRLLVRVRPQRTRRSARSRFDPPPSRRAFVVEMPDGFAPIRGTVARFTGGGGTPTPPMRATRDPFSSPEPRSSTARQTPPTRRTARAHSKPAAVKPRRQPTQKPTRRNVIVVPKDNPEPEVQRETPTVITPSVAKQKEPRPSAQSKTKPSPVKKSGQIKVVKVPSAGAPPQPSSPTNGSETAKDQAKTPTEPAPTLAPEATKAIIPKLLNGAKKTPTDTPSAPHTKTESVGDKNPDSIADLLQKRGKKLRATTTPDTAATTPKPALHTPSAATVSRAPAAGPTLANTLAVLGIVASLMIALAYAAYRFLMPKSASALTTRRLGLRAASQTPINLHAAPDLSIGAKEPGLTSLAQAPVATPKEHTPDKAQRSRQGDVSSALQTTAPQPPSETVSHPPQIAPPQHPVTTLEVPATSGPKFVVPTLSATPESNSTKTTDQKTAPTLSLQSASVLPKSDKREPELPMPVVPQVKQADLDESVLLVPKTRQEALSALGVGENASKDVIERVVAGLRQCWRPDQSNDKTERKHRQQRMEQIETAWRILSEPENAASANAEYQNTKHHDARN